MPGLLRNHAISFADLPLGDSSVCGEGTVRCVEGQRGMWRGPRCVEGTAMCACVGDSEVWKDSEVCGGDSSMCVCVKIGILDLSDMC